MSWLDSITPNFLLSEDRRIQKEQRRVTNRDLQPLIAHLEAAGLGPVSEIADGEPPFTPRGCPFQAWSLGELRRARAAIDRAIAR